MQVGSKKFWELTGLTYNTKIFLALEEPPHEVDLLGEPKKAPRGFWPFLIRNSEKSSFNSIFYYLKWFFSLNKN